MVRQLPPLSAVRAFEAAARHGSFTRAAEELGMTQAAVSYQIKILEDRIGTPLFLRRPRQVALTETGQRLAPAVTDAFELLSAAYQAARHGSQETLVISSVQTFAAQWLARHMGSFQIAHPSLAVRLEVASRLLDVRQDEFDIVIRSGDGNWPGLESHLLVRSLFTPMLSPALAATIGGVMERADIMKLPIVDPGDPWWVRWMEAAGLPTEWLASHPRGQLGAQALEATAAIAGRGVAILTPTYYRTEVAAGQLFQPFDLVLEDPRGYWLAYPSARRNAPKIRAFRDWILAEVNASLALPG